MKRVFMALRYNKTISLQIMYGLKHFENNRVIKLFRVWHAEWVKLQLVKSF